MSAAAEPEEPPADAPMSDSEEEVRARCSAARQASMRACRVVAGNAAHARAALLRLLP